MEHIDIIQPDDFHTHFRQGALLSSALPHTSRNFGRALAMPNTIPPVVSADDIYQYRKEIQAADGSFQPLMTFKITDNLGHTELQDLIRAGAVAGKLYPLGVTTNSADGISEIHSLIPLFRAMAAERLVLCVHGESPGAFCLDRESTFTRTWLPAILAEVPDLQIVMEHVSSAVAVDWILNYRRTTGMSNLAATITPHHLLLTLDDVVGADLSPHHFCKPIPKRPHDRLALINAATSGDPAFFLGTDSAPHLRAAKEAQAGCAGVFNAPVALSLLAQIFSDVGALDRLEVFTSISGAQFYGLPLNDRRVRIANEKWSVPAEYDDIVPLGAGQCLDWTITTL